MSTPRVHRRGIGLFLFCGMVLATSACGLGDTGPARTDTTYQHKAAATAATAASSVSTAQLATEAAADGRAFLAYLSVVMADAEDALGAAANTFASIQPPSPQSDELRSELNELLTKSSDSLATARIAIRRGDSASLDALAADLEQDATSLRQFDEANK
jgi:hypothetical protein